MPALMDLFPGCLASDLMGKVQEYYGYKAASISHL